MYLLDEAMVNNHLWISWKTLLVNDMIAMVETFIHKYCNVKTFQETTEDIDVKFSSKWNYILWYPNVTELLKINWNTYSWVSWTDYKIKNKRNLIFATFDVNHKPDNFWEITFNIKYWYADWSSDFLNLQSAAKALIEDIRWTVRESQWWNADRKLSSISIWDISKNYWGWSGWGSNVWVELAAMQANVTKTYQILEAYKLINIFSN